MKLLVTFGLILICCHAWAIETDGYPPYVDTYKTKVEEFLEKFKAILIAGNASLGLPPLDPYKNDKLPLNLDVEMIKLDAVFTDVDVRGLAAYDVNGGDFKLAGMLIWVDLTWPLIHAVTDYTMKGTIDENMQIFGTGNIVAGVRGFNFSTQVSFKPKGLYLEVKTIETKFSLDHLDFKATGLFDDEEMSEMLSAIISDMLPQLIHDYQADIQGYLHPLMTNLINNFLADKTIWDIIGIIGG